MGLQQKPVISSNAENLLTWFHTQVQGDFVKYLDLFYSWQNAEISLFVKCFFFLQIESFFLLYSQVSMSGLFFPCSAKTQFMVDLLFADSVFNIRHNLCMCLLCFCMNDIDWKVVKLLKFHQPEHRLAPTSHGLLPCKFWVAKSHFWSHCPVLQYCQWKKIFLSTHYGCPWCFSVGSCRRRDCWVRSTWKSWALKVGKRVKATIITSSVPISSIEHFIFYVLFCFFKPVNLPFWVESFCSHQHLFQM